MSRDIETYPIRRVESHENSGQRIAPYLAYYEMFPFAWLMGLKRFLGNSWDDDDVFLLQRRSRAIRDPQRIISRVPSDGYAYYVAKLGEVLSFIIRTRPQ